MPSTIPYDPSLVLGNIVHPGVMEILSEITAHQQVVDAAHDTLNSLISMKRSIGMTITELINMKIDPKDLHERNAEVGKAILKAATDYATVRLEREQMIQPLRAKMQGSQVHLESPVDYVRSSLKKMPLSADSMKMEAQYFSYDGNEQDVNNSLSSVKSFISASTSILGPDISVDMSTAAVEQINKQRELNKIEGTLVLTASCTHKQAQMLAPLYVNVDKGVRVWNRLFSDDKDKIKVDSVESMQAIAAEEGTSKEKFITILSGATYGSSFVGMVHIVRTSSTTTSQRMNSAANHFQLQADAGGFFSKASGGFGLSGSFAKDLKNLMSTQNITSHVTLIAMGIIPTIKSNKIKIGVKAFADFAPDSSMAKLASLHNATTSEKNSVADAANAARTGKQLTSLEGATIESVMEGLKQADDEDNQILNINSMMTAFDDFVEKAIEGSIGVPLTYYTKDFTRAQLAQMWVAKYFPKKYLAISGDDSEIAGQGGGQAKEDDD